MKKNRIEELLNFFSKRLDSNHFDDRSLFGLTRIIENYIYYFGPVNKLDGTLPEKIIDFFKGGNIFFNSQEVRIIETSLSANIRVGLEDFMSRLEIPSHKTKDSKSDSKKIQTVDTEILKVEAIVQFVNQKW